jgi:NADH:ubiquinone oxidoreductase subunit 5 (subunit L)/multisubunit Na+/H+ antiporter MnhA subunit
MSLAWTTILIIALLLPGVFFFIGLSLKERFSREVVRSNAIGEVGLAILVALILHLLAYAAVTAVGFDLAEFIGPLTTHDNAINLHSAVKIVVRGSIYTIIMGVIGFGIGLGAASLPVFARHKWITTVNDSMQDGIVTAYVMTTTVQNNRALMYKGVLSEFYLTLDGSLTYIILKNCSRFFMKMDGDGPTTTAQLKLFGSAQDNRESWDYLFIDAKNIANVLFDPSPEIKTSDKGTEALEKALAELNALLDSQPPPPGAGTGKAEISN